MVSPKLVSLSLSLGLVMLGACAHSASSRGGAPYPAESKSTAAPTPDPRIALRAGATDAAEAIWNLRALSKTPPSQKFVDGINSDLAFTGPYAIQGSFHGYQVWDISRPARPRLETAYVCPGSQSDVSTYKNLLFVSGENLSARLDCGVEGVEDTVSAERLRGIRIYDISDIAHPKNVGNVQTCRGSHTHTLLVDPKDRGNVYVYISGQAPVRSPNELAGCVMAPNDPNSALFRIEVIKVPLAHPDQAAIVSSPRIFNNLVAPKTHPDTPEDSIAKVQALADAKAHGGFIGVFEGKEEVVHPMWAAELLDSMVKARHGTGAPTAADSAALKAALPGIIEGEVKAERSQRPDSTAGPTQCHDITVYPAIGLAGGACAGYGLLLDIKDPAHPVRLAAAADSNFSYWHSATFNNAGTKLLFSDEWGGGVQPKCRKTDPKEWGADAIFTLQNRQMQFQGYYKLPVAQTPEENCVAHNGSLIPIPGRDVMVQAWYQGGLSVFDWTDPKHPKEIAYFDRGPLDATKLELGGYWSAYWYNGVIVGSEITRGLDIFELKPSGFISQNEIDAAKSVHLDYLNAQSQPKLVWPKTYSLARAYLDQLERSKGLEAGKIAAAREELAIAEKASGTKRQETLSRLVSRLESDVAMAGDASKVRALAGAVMGLAEPPVVASRQ
ncbi:MAG: LVIVD repeat-containing protein [Gemmatimonadales bacterium]